MLRTTEMSIEEIAFTIGFSSARAFQRAFRRWFDAAPGEFRRHAAHASALARNGSDSSMR